MISREKGRDIAGQILIEKYGREFLTNNIEKLTLVESRGNGVLTVHFGMFKNSLEEEPPVLRNGGIYVEENVFPETILSVEVNLKDGSTKVIEK
jgi:hypothetical protein